jgi:hypothetical protein
MWRFPIKRRPAARSKPSSRHRGRPAVVGLTYGTPATTNNKENQILVKLRAGGFELEDPARGILVDTATHTVRVYRVVGIGFWSFIGNPAQPNLAEHTFLEALLALSLAMRAGAARAAVVDEVQKKGLELAKAIEVIVSGFPKELFPEWARRELSDTELGWLTTSITSFFDEGI